MIALSIIRHIFKWIIAVFFVSTLFFVVLYKFVPVPVTPLMVIRCVQQVGHGETIRLKHHWVSMKRISPYLAVAVRASEDQRFLSHHGFDFTEIGNAVSKKLNGGRLRGGSTISQQTAKNVYLWQSRTYVRKAFELYYTTLMEVFWTKERIMEMYLNMIEMGDGIYGAEMAAKEYFKKPAKKLSKSESALIAASLPNPRKRNPARPSNYMVGRKILILQGMKRTGIVKLSDEPKKEEDQKNEKSEN